MELKSSSEAVVESSEVKNLKSDPSAQSSDAASIVSCHSSQLKSSDSGKQCGLGTYADSRDNSEYCKL